MPTKVGLGDVAVVRSLTAQLRALAELHTLAGWCAYDMHLIDLANWHYVRAINLAGEAGDVLTMTSAANHQAVGWGELGASNDALKLWQMGGLRLVDVPDDIPGKANQQAWHHLGAADSFADLGLADQAREERKRAAALPPMTDPFEAADASYTQSGIELAIGRLDVAEQHATTSLRTFGQQDRRDSAPARIRLATIHAKALEPDTPRLAVAALEAVQGLRSVRTRALLAPLENALLRARDTASIELARRARAVRTGSG